MKKAEKIIDAIGQIDDRYIEAAHSPQIRKKNRQFKWIAAAAVICIAAPLPTATAWGVDEAYKVLYMVSPKIAQTFKPVQKACEDKGIRMEVVSADVQGDTANFYITLTDEQGRLDETVDLYDSYRINCPFDSVGHVSFSEFDEKTGTAHFLVNVKTMNGENIPKGKVTFGLRELLFNKKTFDGLIDEIDLSEVPTDPLTTRNIDYRGHSSHGDSELENMDFRYLVPSETPIASPMDGVTITGIGYIDGALHIQTYYENILKTDNHGFYTFVDENGEIYGERENDSFNVSFWDKDRTGSYDELIYPITYEELGKYSLNGWFQTCNGYENGDWEVTFKIE